MEKKNKVNVSNVGLTLEKDIFQAEGLKHVVFQFHFYVFRPV